MMKRKPTHPGEFVREDILNEFGLSRKPLAELLNVSEKTINELADQKRGLSPDIADIGRNSLNRRRTGGGCAISADTLPAILCRAGLHHHLKNDPLRTEPERIPAGGLKHEK